MLAVEGAGAMTDGGELPSESSDSLLDSEATAAEPFLSALEMGLTFCLTATLGEDCLDRGRLCGDLTALMVAGLLLTGKLPCNIGSQVSHVLTAMQLKLTLVTRQRWMT